MRVSDAERQVAADGCGRALAEGRLDFTEYDPRLARPSQAVTYADLDQLFTDLPVSAARRRRPRWPRRRARRPSPAPVPAVRTGFARPAAGAEDPLDDLGRSSCSINLTVVAAGQPRQRRARLLLADVAGRAGRSRLRPAYRPSGSPSSSASSRCASGPAADPSSVLRSRHALAWRPSRSAGRRARRWRVPWSASVCGSPMPSARPPPNRSAPRSRTAGSTSSSTTTRIARAYGAVTYGDLDRLFTDLPRPRGPHGLSAVPPAPTADAPMPVPQVPGPAARGADRRGARNGAADAAVRRHARHLGLRLRLRDPRRDEAAQRRGPRRRRSP